MLKKIHNGKIDFFFKYYIFYCVNMIRIKLLFLLKSLIYKGGLEIGVF
jgi:hypothetical protein